MLFDMLCTVQQRPREQRLNRARVTESRQKRIKREKPREQPEPNLLAGCPVDTEAGRIAGDEVLQLRVKLRRIHRSLFWKERACASHVISVRKAADFPRVLDVARPLVAEDSVPGKIR